ncbi:major facilitator superfamily domain-containing protein [Cladochytrium replicatum]|nr:major facilitator superfamily domain-containing protein [Cladochytrium replicatum]
MAKMKYMNVDAATEETLIATESESEKKDDSYEVQINETPLSWSDLEEIVIVRKMDKNIIPWVTAMYLLSFLDRVNIANAAGVGSMEGDLGLTGDQYNWALSIFFVGYVIFEVPSNLMLKGVRPSRWLARILVTWGIFAALLAASLLSWSSVSFSVLWKQASSQASCFTCRSGTVSTSTHVACPGSLQLLRQLVLSGGLLAFGIARLDGAGGLAGWRWVFLLEGGKNNVIILNDRERKIANERLKRENVDPHEVEFSWHQFTSTVSDVKVWIWMILYISQLIPLYSFSFFLPSIVRGLGFTSLNAQAMSSPPFLVACLASVASGYSSDHLKDRSLHAMFGMLQLAQFGKLRIRLKHFIRAGYCLNLFLAARFRPQHGYSICTHHHLRNGGLLHHSPNRWVSNNVSGSTGAGVALAMVVGFGNIGGAIAGQVYKSSDAINFYQTSHIVNGSLTIVGILLVLIQRLYLISLNKKRAEAEKSLSLEGNPQTSFVTADSPRFRWQL